MMYDHLTPLNTTLLRDLNNDARIQKAWYYNGKVFSLDEKGHRYKFDITDSVSEKLKNTHSGTSVPLIWIGIDSTE